MLATKVRDRMLFCKKYQKRIQLKLESQQEENYIGCVITSQHGVVEQYGQKR